MKGKTPVILALIAVVFLVSAAHSQSGQAVPVPATQNAIGAPEQELIDLSVSLMDAVERKDRPTIERLVGENFVLNSPGDAGYAIARNGWIDNSINMDWTNMKFNNFKVRIYGDTATVSSLFDFKVSGGKIPIPISSNTELIDVWTKRDGQWRLDSRNLGAYSIAAKFRIAAGFIGGIVFCGLIWLILRLRRRFARA
jgi:hypothetical protein